MNRPELRLSTRGADETREVGRIVGKDLCPGDLLALTGDLGSGKTCLVQGIARGLDVPERSCVRSPSFIIVNMYNGLYPLYHLDLYRVRDPAELEDLGFREIFFGEGVTLVEWADKIEGFLPEEHLRVHLSFLNPTMREIHFLAKGRRFLDRLSSWRTAFSRWN